MNYWYVTISNFHPADTPGRTSWAGPRKRLTWGERDPKCAHACVQVPNANRQRLAEQRRAHMNTSLRRAPRLSSHIHYQSSRQPNAQHGGALCTRSPDRRKMRARRQSALCHPCPPSRHARLRPRASVLAENPWYPLPPEPPRTPHTSYSRPSAVVRAHTHGATARDALCRLRRPYTHRQTDARRPVLARWRPQVGVKSV